MSISEAVQLIIKARTLGKKGDVFVLDMGTPVKIADLAKDLIRLTGMKEDEIEIKYVGLRPGEMINVKHYFPPTTNRIPVFRYC